MKNEDTERYLNGEMSRAAERSFEEVLRQSPEKLEEVLSQKEMDAVLGVLLSGPKQLQRPEEFRQGVMARLASEGAEESKNQDRDFSKSVLTEIIEEREGARPLRWPDLVRAGAIAAAASIAIMFFLQTIIFPNLQMRRPNWGSQNAIAETFIAEIQSGNDAVWESGPNDHGWVEHGLLKLKSGIAEIGFNSGAQVVLEGPSAISLQTSNRAFLEYGKLTADVPPQASGFAVNTPRLNIVDIGTRFGVSVDQDGNSELHVMEGEVEASRSSGNAITMLVREGISLRADSRTRSSLQPIPYAGDQFTLKLPGNPEQITSTPPNIAFTFDESGGATLVGSGTEAQEASLFSDSDIPTPRRAPGYAGGGLVFQKGQQLDIDLPKGVALNEPLTIQFRVKIQPRLGLLKNREILRFGNENDAWVISCSQNKTQGGKGTVRVSTGENEFILGSSDIADGRWHHVAVRFLGGSNAQLASHTAIFVDSKRQDLHGMAETGIRAGVADKLQLGKATDGFIGWVDEIEIFQKALTTREIQKASPESPKGVEMMQ